MSNILVLFTASILIWIIFFYALYFFYRQKTFKVYLMTLVFALCLNYLITLPLKEFIPFSFRPFWIEGLPISTLTIPTNPSFPSDHTAFAVTLSVVTFIYNKRLGIFYFVFAVLIGVSRVLANVHYPVDIVGGAILGIFTALISDLFFRKIFVKK